MYKNSRHFQLPANASFAWVRATPVGDLLAVTSSEGLHAVVWEEGADEFTKILPNKKQCPIFLECEKQLKEYFSKKRKKFDLPLVLQGSDFQMAAWRELQKIPYGGTLTYAEQACKMGNAKACRAVGSANSVNPVSIVIPCHRVIAKSGRLAGFGGGLDRKQALLSLEHVG